MCFFNVEFHCSLNSNSMKKALFIDRDGIVNKKIPNDYVKNIEEFIFQDEILPILQWGKSRDYLLILITNQQGIGKGVMSESDLQTIHNHMNSILLDRIRLCFDDIYFCPDLAESRSYRRKPNPGMLLEAIEKWNINPKQSWMIGDSISDAKAGNLSGTRTILVGNYSAEQVPEADFIIPDLKEALSILEQ
jgi:D-glycero-D-manno-heptose 1,7-bisphosphate phosphatase